MRVISKLVSWLSRHLVAQGDENDYYAWADSRLDELAEKARRNNARYR